MYGTHRTIITTKNSFEIHGYCRQMCSYTKKLSNASLFRIRNHFTASNKDKLTDNEQEVEDEIAMLDKKPKKVLSYTQLNRLMRVTENPDFFAGLPMQSAEAVLRQECQDFSDWIKSLKQYKKHPEKYNGKPNMPKYCKNELKTCTITNQDAVLYPRANGKGSELKLPLIKERLVLSDVSPDSVLKEVKIVPYYDDFMIMLTFETDDVYPSDNMQYMAGIDFGVNNIAAIVTNEQSALLYKGGAVKSENQWYNKKHASLTSAMTKGKENAKAHSHAINSLCRHRDLFITDNLHKISRSIVNFFKEHDVGVVFLGTSHGWKQNSNIGRHNNQNFVSMPFEKLRRMIKYKCMLAGILVFEQEESYTSKADFLAGDKIPVYGKESREPSFSGSRISRGLYKSSDGTIINADINGAANILRKAVPNAFDDVKDFKFLQHTRVFGYKDLNPVTSIHEQSAI